MSAWILSKAHIDALVMAAMELELSWYSEPEPENYDPSELRAITHTRLASEVGMMLWAENLASIHYRYPDTGESDADYPGPADFSQLDVARYRFEPTKHLSPVVLLKAINCYEYQSSEHPGWEKSEARAFCEALRDALIRKLPGYREAPWDLEEEDVRSDGASEAAHVGELDRS